ncbi:MAG TPA: hypothetical protein VFV34_24670, partial [Blastocatellia bacterium]|nr:hypothetical protein [Blastocatellia bacterium]
MKTSTFVSIVLLLLLAAGCTRAPEQPATSGPGKSGKAVESGSSSLFDAINKGMQGVKCFRARVTSTGSQIGESEAILEVVMPDRYR